MGRAPWLADGSGCLFPDILDGGSFPAIMSARSAISVGLDVLFP